jgi:hypothetical protein
MFHNNRLANDRYWRKTAVRLTNLLVLASLTVQLGTVLTWSGELPVNRSNRDLDLHKCVVRRLRIHRWS